MALFILVFFFKDSATTEIDTYGHTLSLHDARPVCSRRGPGAEAWGACAVAGRIAGCRLGCRLAYCCRETCVTLCCTGRASCITVRFTTVAPATRSEEPRLNSSH